MLFLHEHVYSLTDFKTKGSGCFPREVECGLRGRSHCLRLVAGKSTLTPPQLPWLKNYFCSKSPCSTLQCLQMQFLARGWIWIWTYLNACFHRHKVNTRKAKSASRSTLCVCQHGIVMTISSRICLRKLDEAATKMMVRAPHVFSITHHRVGPAECKAAKQAKISEPTQKHTNSPLTLTWWNMLLVLSEFRTASYASGFTAKFFFEP